MGFSGSLGQTLTTKEIFDLVKDDLKQVERELSVESAAGVEAVTHIAGYLHAGGGKRVRPILLLLAARMNGAVTPEAIRMAAVVELIHAATLIHDDIIDMAQTRKGRPSSREHANNGPHPAGGGLCAVNAIWGNHMSVLAGDWLYMQAFQSALRERNFHILDLLIHLTQTMVEGELLQLERMGKMDISEADYLRLIDRKTASLFSVCAKLGSHMTGAGDEAESKLGEFAWNLGMAFQLLDDVLDFTARETVLGKPAGNNLREGKVTLPLIYALETANVEERRLVETVLQDRNHDTVRLGRILKMMERHRGVERVKERARNFTDRAKALIGEFPDSPYRRALTAVTDLVAGRGH